MRAVTAACVALGLLAPACLAYIEIPYTLGRTCQESTNILLVEVARVNKDKGIVVFKKVRDLKGKHPEGEIKQNIGKRGFHPREWQTIMAWAEVGKKAVFFHNGGASETCIGDYWYQCYREGEWWGMSHAEPFMLRTYCGDPERLAAAVTAMQQGREVVIACMADGNRDQLHVRKGKLQRLKASLKLQDYNPRRDFAGWGGDDGTIIDYKTQVLLAEGSPGWRFLPAGQAAKLGDRWRAPDFDDSGWRTGKAPVGYGEPEIGKRAGTVLGEKGQPFLFRRAFDVPAPLLGQKGITFRISLASDDCAAVYLNGVLVDEDPGPDHEFQYWNRDVEVKAPQLRPGRNVLAVLVKNGPSSSDLYLDVEVVAQTVIVRKAPDAKAAATSQAPAPAPRSPVLGPTRTRLAGTARE